MGEGDAAGCECARRSEVGDAAGDDEPELYNKNE